ncbi:hypothetical protein DIPPA_23911 [Diplonema papillatum]|nr:hypothetical protein DIPPA_23911 [Diplonema papillatum]
MLGLLVGNTSVQDRGLEATQPARWGSSEMPVAPSESMAPPTCDLWNAHELQDPMGGTCVFSFGDPKVTSDDGGWDNIARSLRLCELGPVGTSLGGGFTAPTPAPTPMKFFAGKKNIVEGNTQPDRTDLILQQLVSLFEDGSPDSNASSAWCREKKQAFDSSSIDFDDRGSDAVGRTGGSRGSEPCGSPAETDKTNASAAHTAYSSTASGDMVTACATSNASSAVCRTPISTQKDPHAHAPAQQQQQQQQQAARSLYFSAAEPPTPFSTPARPFLAKSAALQAKYAQGYSQQCVAAASAAATPEQVSAKRSLFAAAGDAEAALPPLIPMRDDADSLPHTPAADFSYQQPRGPPVRGRQLDLQQCALTPAESAAPVYYRQDSSLPYYDHQQQQQQQQQHAVTQSPVYNQGMQQGVGGPEQQVYQQQEYTMGSQLGYSTPGPYGQSPAQQQQASGGMEGSPMADMVCSSPPELLPSVSAARCSPMQSTPTATPNYEARGEYMMPSPVVAQDDMTVLVMVEFKMGRCLKYVSSASIMQVPTSTPVIVKGDRGEHFGYLRHGLSEQSTEEPSGTVLRVASPEEVAEHAQHQTMEEEALAMCRQKTAEYGLVMELCYAEYQLDMKKLTFFYRVCSFLPSRRREKAFLTRYSRHALASS